ncbi:hypothetical protein MTP10_16755 [Nonomuraea sp. 3-1Str]|uniref:hypothetical protein n=1 Tax=Nonomuraea sp. 3-1Str TaxID=2929801 RepID=UPI00285717D5|nr:hypothetical protein [Nonomuraea sp. 3-1Str]MDR8410381.1 hypothetical protein [Nonomuraea sp. 3-1Str]
MTEFTGVKQPEFDTMAGRHTEAAGRLEELAAALHGELQSAGLDTAPAARLRQLAERVTAQAADLRRRQQLVRELQRQKVTFGRSTPAGSFLEMPDALEAAQGLLDGTLAARAALKAADGDEAALPGLERYASRTGDAEFVKAFLGALGAAGATRLPGSLAGRVREAKVHDDPEGAARLSAEGAKVLRMLATALARGTDPKSPAYLGETFLTDLVKEGRADHRVGNGAAYSGYQALALVWAAHDGRTPFSKEFMEVVGRDVIAYEYERRKDEWKVGQALWGIQTPIIDLAAALGLGTALRPGPQVGAPGAGGRSSVVDDLFHAAKSSREASQALLNHTPAGSKESALHYLLTTRWEASRYLGDYQPFNDMLVTATTGRDETSKMLAAQMTKTLSDEVRGAFGKDDSGNLEIRDRDLFDRYAPLRRPLGLALAANVDELSRLLLNHATFGEVAAKDMSYALALATSDDDAFEALVRAQTEHMRAALGATLPPGTDIKQFLTDRTVEEARPFGHIVEIRRQVLIAQGLDDKKADEALKSMVGDAIGLLPVPGARRVGELATGAFGDLVSSGYDKLAGAAYDQLAEQVAQRMSEHGKGLDETYQTLANDQEAVERLAEQLLATAMLNKGMLDRLDLGGQPFAAGSPATLKPFTEMTPEDYSKFLKWARRASGSSELLNDFRTTFGANDDVHAYLGLDPSSGGDE